MSNFILITAAALFCTFLPFPDRAQGAAFSSQSSQSRILAASDISQSKLPGQEAQKKAPLSPEQTVERLAAKSSDWQEPSKHSEERYKKAILLWLDAMQPQQREQAHKILKEAHPDMHALRSAIRDKKKELANMSFNRHTTPEALPRLGQELQNLRKQLRSRLERISLRLRQEAGVSMGPLDGDAFWLLPQDIEPVKPKALHKDRPAGNANSKNSPHSIIS